MASALDAEPPQSAVGWSQAVRVSHITSCWHVMRMAHTETAFESVEE